MGHYLWPCRAADARKSERFQESLSPMGTHYDHNEQMALMVTVHANVAALYCGTSFT